MTSQTTRILADTPIWVDYFRGLSTGLQPLLQREQLVTHPLVLGELFMGGFADRPGKLEQLSRLDHISGATNDEVFDLMESGNSTVVASAFSMLTCCLPR